MIPPEELDDFRADLVKTLRRYRRTTARQLGQKPLLDVAKELDSRREGYEDELSSDRAKSLSKAGREAVVALNSRMETSAGLLRDLSSLVAAFRKPTASGGLPGLSDDLAILTTRFGEVKESVEGLMKEVDSAKAVLSRARGSAKGRTPPRTRSYWYEPMAAGAEYRR